MYKGLLLTALAAALMFAGAILLFLMERRVKHSKSIAVRLDEELRPNPAAHARGTGEHLVLGWAHRMLQRAGFVRRPGHLLIVALVSMLICVGAFQLNGFVALLAAMGSLCAGVYLFILWRAAATHKKMLEQLPGFIDIVIRTMGIGRSFDSALLHAIDDIPEPLSEALEIVKIESSMGGNLVDALQYTAQIYRIKELHLLTLALRINQRYGGSIKAMLENIITIIRRREQADRELRALTGETRLSAWLLGTMPLAVAGYMMIVNPSYIQHLVDDPNGTTIIATAIGLQASGALILWRMMRSIR